MAGSAALTCVLSVMTFQPFAVSYRGSMSFVLADYPQTIHATSNPQHLKAFQRRRINGMGLSRRVWNLRTQYKRELELGLSVGIERGTSANALARELKQYLK